jgi:hypothetical protein
MATSYYVQIRLSNGGLLTDPSGLTWFAVTDPSFAAAAANGNLGFGALSFDIGDVVDQPTLFGDLAAGTVISSVELAGYGATATGTSLVQDDIFSTVELSSISTDSAGNATVSLGYDSLREQSNTYRADGTPYPDTIDGWNASLDKASTAGTVAASVTGPPAAAFPGSSPLEYYVQFREANGTLLADSHGSTWFAVTGVSVGQSVVGGGQVTFGALSFTLAQGTELPGLLVNEGSNEVFSQIEVAGYAQAAQGFDLVQDDVYKLGTISSETTSSNGSVALQLNYGGLLEQSYTTDGGTRPNTLSERIGWDATTNKSDDTFNSPTGQPGYASAASLTALPATAATTTPQEYYIQFRVSTSDTLTAPGGATWFAVTDPNFATTVTNSKLDLGALSFTIGNVADLPALLGELTSGGTMSAVELAGYAPTASGGMALVQDDIFSPAEVSSITADSNGYATISLTPGALREQSDAYLPSGAAEPVSIGGWSKILNEPSTSGTVAAPTSAVPTVASAPSGLTYYVQFRNADGSVLADSAGATWFAVSDVSAAQSTALGAGAPEVSFGPLSITLAQGSELPGLLEDEASLSAFTQIELAGYNGNTASSDLVQDDLFKLAGISGATTNSDGSATLQLQYGGLLEQSYAVTGGSNALSERIGWNALTKTQDNSSDGIGGDTGYPSAAALTGVPVAADTDTPTQYDVQFTLNNGSKLTAPDGSTWFAVTDPSFATTVTDNKFALGPVSFSIGDVADVPALFGDLAAGTPLRSVELAGYVQNGQATPLVQDDLFGTAVVSTIATDSNGDATLSLGYSTLREQSDIYEPNGTAEPVTVGGWNATLKETSTSGTVAASLTAPPVAAPDVSTALSYYVQFRDVNGNIVPATGDAMWVAVSDVSVAQNSVLSSAPNFGALTITLQQGSEVPGLLLDEGLASAFTQIELAGYNGTSGTADLVQDDLFKLSSISNDADNSDGSVTLTLDYDGLLEQSYAVANGANALYQRIGWDDTTNTADNTSNGLDGKTGYASDATLMGAPCYCPGTMIRTPYGEVAVERLRVGDLVTTLSGESEPIMWIGRRSYKGRIARIHQEVHPVIIQAEAFGRGVPEADLHVSPCHALFLDGVLVPAWALVNGASITQPRHAGDLHYFHLELERHCVIWANGAPAESFFNDGTPAMFDNRAERPASAGSPPHEPFAPWREQGEAVERIRQRIGGLYQGRRVGFSPVHLAATVAVG